MLTVIISDSAQYLQRTRLLGRRPLAPSISPKKTVEGAVSGLAAGLLALPLIGQWWLPSVPAAALSLLGAAVVVARDCRRPVRVAAQTQRRGEGFLRPDSGARRYAGSHRQLLFAAPVYYVFLRYAP